MKTPRIHSHTARPQTQVMAEKRRRVITRLAQSRSVFDSMQPVVLDWKAPSDEQIAEARISIPLRKDRGY